MSKPDDISQSAWDAACAVVDEIWRARDVWSADSLVARAIMAETEACAVIADCDCEAAFCEHREKAELIRARLKP